MKQQNSWELGRIGGRQVGDVLRRAGGDGDGIKMSRPIQESSWILTCVLTLAVA
jgi:hypothetical protein